MKKDCSENDALCKAEAYCATAERCEAEVRAKLQQWGAPVDCFDRIIDRLMENNFINSSRYVRAFVREKYRFSKWGRQKIFQALRMKQLPSSLIDEALEEVDRDEYLSNLTSLLQRKMKEVKARNDYERNGKLIRFALSRGFEMNDILYCLKQTGCNDESLA